PRERTCLPRRESVVPVVVEHKHNRIIAANRMDQVPDALAEARTISSKCHHGQIHVRKLRTGCKRKYTSVETMEAVAEELIAHVPVAAHVVAEQHTMRRDAQTRE